MWTSGELWLNVDFENFSSLTVLALRERMQNIRNTKKKWILLIRGKMRLLEKSNPLTLEPIEK